MSESTIKMMGLISMILSVFVILFGTHASEVGAPGFVAPILVIIGLILLFVGTIFYVIVKKD